MAFFATGELWGWSEAQLLAGLAKAQTDFATGSSLISVASGDVSQARMVQNNAAERIQLFKRGLYEIYVQDNTNYSNYANFWDSGLNQVVGRVSL